MAISAQEVAAVDFYAQAREELEALLIQISQPVTLSHVALGRAITRGRETGGRRGVPRSA